MEYWLERFRYESAYLEFSKKDYHVKTVSGKHIDKYLNTDYIVSKPSLLNDIIDLEFIPKIDTLETEIDWVITYPPYGLPIASVLSNKLNIKFAYIQGGVSNECFFNLQEGENCLIIADDIYSGKSLLRVIESIHSKKASSKYIFSLANFQENDILFNHEVFSLIKLPTKLWSELDCPLCKLGSKAVHPRSNWNILLDKC